MSIETQNIENKTKGQIQAELAMLGNQLETLRQEFNILSSQKSQLKKDIETEQALYDSMVLKTTAEMQQQVEAEILVVQEKLKKLQIEAEEVTANIIQKKVEYKQVMDTMSVLVQGIEKAKVDFNKEARLAQTKLDATNEQLGIANRKLDAALKLTDKAKKEEDAAKKNAEFHKQSQKEYAKFLDRKNRDLTIWQERLEPAFKKKFPKGEMSFV